LSRKVNRNRQHGVTLLQKPYTSDALAEIMKTAMPPAVGGDAQRAG